MIRWRKGAGSVGGFADGLDAGDFADADAGLGWDDFEVDCDLGGGGGENVDVLDGEFDGVKVPLDSPSGKVIVIFEAVIEVLQLGEEQQALAVAAAVVASLREWRPPNNGWTPLRFKGLELGEAPGEQEYEVSFETSTLVNLEEEE